MEKTYKIINSVGLWELSTDADHILHRIDSDNYTENRRIIVIDPDVWEEVAVADMPLYTQAEYKDKIVSLVREKYDLDDECAILRQRDVKPEEFEEYYAYVEQCKQTARIILSANGAENGNE